MANETRTPISGCQTTGQTGGVIAWSYWILACVCVFVFIWLASVYWRNRSGDYHSEPLRVLMYGLGVATLQFYEDVGRWPKGMEELLDDNFVAGRTVGITGIPVDEWGRPLVLVIDRAERFVILMSTGADGIPGGQGQDADSIMAFGVETPRRGL